MEQKISKHTVSLYLWSVPIFTARHPSPFHIHRETCSAARRHHPRLHLWIAPAVELRDGEFSSIHVTMRVWHMHIFAYHVIIVNL